ncbi:effector-associated constant component EACC1 [Streptomyces sp. SAS_275]|uniref:effector-associated constant component EACC1 n=1 Tax=Streptomyces sp. SAS_275 TaxID=3412746 RepID=UPI00403D508B
MTSQLVHIRKENGDQVSDGLRLFIQRDAATSRSCRAFWDSAPPVPGTLGTGLDVLAIALSSTLALPSAIDVISRWCASLGPAAPRVRIQVGEVSVTVEGRIDAQEIGRVAAVLATALPARSTDEIDQETA